MDFEDIRKEVIHGSLDCMRKGLIRQTSGNISIADKQAGIYVITPSGIPYEKLSPSDVPVLALEDGGVIEGALPPSKESPMHRAILNKNPLIHSVVHTHSLYATVMSIILDDALPPFAIGSTPYCPVRIAPYAVPGSDEIAQEALKAMGEGLACLLKYHGQIAAGKTMWDAISAADYIEENAQTAYLTYAVGKYTPLPYDDYIFLHERALKNMGLPCCAGG